MQAHFGQTTLKIQEDTMEKLEKAITKIIRTIEPGCYFDTHTVILLLLKNDHDAYLSGAGNHASTKPYHAKISKIIKANEALVEAAGNSYSKNVYDHFSDCHLWLRKKKPVKGA